MQCIYYVAVCTCTGDIYLIAKCHNTCVLYMRNSSLISGQLCALKSNETSPDMSLKFHALLVYSTCTCMWQLHCCLRGHLWQNWPFCWSMSLSRYYLFSLYGASVCQLVELAERAFFSYPSCPPEVWCLRSQSNWLECQPLGNSKCNHDIYRLTLTTRTKSAIYLMPDCTCTLDLFHLLH